MKIQLFGILTMLCIALIYPLFLTNYERERFSQSDVAPEWFAIEGLVENPLSLTYAELWNFPLLSEVTMLECIGSGQGGISITYNWTGVPLFHLLSMAKVISGDYREVVFKATDGFSSSVLLDTAMHPTTILALEANGTDLEQVTGLGGGYRVVLPCRWGYKWVKWIERIIIVDYDYEGTYEQQGLSDEAVRPNCTMPSTDPPIRIFNATEMDDHVVQVLSNSSIDSFSFDSNQRFTFVVSGTEESNGYFYVTFPKILLGDPYQIYVDENLMKYSQTNEGSNVYLYFNYATSAHKIEVWGVRLLDEHGGGCSARPLLK